MNYRADLEREANDIFEKLKTYSLQLHPESRAMFDDPVYRTTVVKDLARGLEHVYDRAFVDQAEFFGILPQDG